MNFPKILNISFLMSIILFCVFFVSIQSVSATISREEADNLLAGQFIERSDKNVDAYMQCINAGMTNEQARDNIERIADLTPSSTVPVPIAGGSWSYVGDNNHRVLVFQPSSAFIPTVPENKRNEHYTKRRIDGIEEVIGEEHGRSAEDYNDAVNNYKQALGNSPLHGTEVEGRLLDIKRHYAPNPNSRHFAESVERRVDSMRNAQQYGLFDKIAQIARDNNVDLNNVVDFQSSLQIPPGEYSVKIQTNDGKAYDANGEANPQTENQGGGTPGTQPGGQNSSGNGTPGTQLGGQNSSGNGIQTGGQSSSGNPNSGVNNSQETGGIVPCGKNTGEGETKSSACTICHLIDGIHNIVQKLVEWMVFAALVIITVAGIMYIVSAGNPAIVTMAKTAMKNALIGIIIILTAFMMITFIVNKAFNNPDATLTVEEGGLESSGFGRMWNFECK